MSDSPGDTPAHPVEPCIESKLLALHISTVCLARTLAASGLLDRDVFSSELAQARDWMSRFDDCGHHVESFDALCSLLRDV